MSEIYDMTYSDELRNNIEEISSTTEKNLLLNMFDEFGKYIQQNEEDEDLTFGEFCQIRYGYDLFKEDVVTLCNILSSRYHEGLKEEIEESEFILKEEKYILLDYLEFFKLHVDKFSLDTNITFGEFISDICN